MSRLDGCDSVRRARTVALLATVLVITAVDATACRLMDVDPWGPEDFGSAGNIAGDLVDSTFEPAPCK